MSQRKKSQKNNSIFDATKQMSIGMPVRNIEVGRIVEDRVKRELNIFKTTNRVFDFYWRSYINHNFFDRYEFYCYGTTGHNRQFDLTRICMIEPQEEGVAGALPSLYIYEEDRSFNRSAIGRGHEAPWRSGINERIGRQFFDQGSLQLAYEMWYSRKSEFGKAMIDLINASHNLTWEEHNYGVPQYMIYLDGLPLGPVPRNEYIPKDEMKEMILQLIPR